MPKVYMSEREQLCARVARWVYGEIGVRRITITELARRRGITHQAMSKKLISESFSYEDFVFFVKEFKPTQKELLELVGLY